MTVWELLHKLIVRNVSHNTEIIIRTPDGKMWRVKSVAEWVADNSIQLNATET